MGQTQGQEFPYDGHKLPYDVGETFTCLSSKTIWSVHAGKKKSSGDPVTVFVFDHNNKSPEEIMLAQAAHHRLKTLRHPNMLKYIDGVELPTCIYAVTEEVVPLEDYIATSDGSSEFSMAWGLHQVLKSVSFLNKDCGLVHRNISLASIFVDVAGEWKLGGLEFMHNYGETSPPPKGLEQICKYEPPETSTLAAASRRAEKWSVDVWGLGCLVWEVFNGHMSKTSDLKTPGKIHKTLVPLYLKMVSANPRARPSPAVLLDGLREHGGFLAGNFISIALRIEEVQIMEPMQRNDFFNELNKSLDSFPEKFSKHKILPQLINAFEFGGAGSSVLVPLFKLGVLLKGEEYQKKIVPCVVKLFSSTDRATRLNLLQQLENFVDHLLPVTVNDQIFPHVAHGFTDTVSTIRELTVKATVLLAPKLSKSTLNGQLLMYLAKCQLDEKPEIRVHTNVCLGKIAGYLSPATRQKVLVTALLRALKDPFPPARIAAIEAMAATQAFFSMGDLSARVLPGLCTITIDKEKDVRDQVFKVIRFFLARLEKMSEDPQAAAEQEKVEASVNSWTGWAMSSLTSKFYQAAPRSQAVASSETTQSTTDERQREATPGLDKISVKKDSGGSAIEGEEGRRVHQGEGTKSSGLMMASTNDDVWQDEEWEDTITGTAMCMSKKDPSLSCWEEVGEVAAKKDSDIESWEDDGWGTTFISHDHSRNTESSQQSSLRGGADFFDSFSTAKKSSGSSHITESPLKYDFLPPSGGQAGQNIKAPPFTSASLFGDTSGTSTANDQNSKTGSSLGNVTSFNVDDGGGGWEDWNEDFEVKPDVQEQDKREMKPRGERNQPMSEASIGVDNSGWSTLDTPDSDPCTKMDTSMLSKQELRQKRMEERRLKQQAAREKRSAGSHLKSGGLGTVKRD